MLVSKLQVPSSVAIETERTKDLSINDRGELVVTVRNTSTQAIHKLTVTLRAPAGIDVAKPEQTRDALAAGKQ